MEKKLINIITATLSIMGVAAFGLFVALRKDNQINIELENYTTEEKKAILTAMRVKEAFHFGKWYDPSTWYEEDSKIVELLNKSPEIFTEVCKFYNSMYGRSLVEDIIRYLDEDSYNNLHELIKIKLNG